jgi:hypothetical protein
MFPCSQILLKVNRHGRENGETEKGVAVNKKSYILNLKYTNLSFHERLNDNVLKCAKNRKVLEVL